MPSSWKTPAGQLGTAAIAMTSAMAATMNTRGRERPRERSVTDREAALWFASPARTVLTPPGVAIDVVIEAKGCGRCGPSRATRQPGPAAAVDRRGRRPRGTRRSRAERVGAQL